MIENPIIRGFAPDPSIIRVGDDYYIATSTFEWWPGVHIHHSRDLKNWTLIPSPIRRKSQADLIGNPTSGGIWAPCLSYYDGIFYLVYTDVKTKKGKYYNNHNYVITTDNIYGEWSEPVYLNSSGFDPSLFHDVDGKKYLLNMKNGFQGILLQEYNVKEAKLVGDIYNIYQGTEYGYTEGPHLYRIGDWYYLMVAEGGTGYGHCVTMARSKHILGPYETDPMNPMLTSKEGDGSYLKRCGHGDMVETKDGQWYLVHLCSRPKEGTQLSLLGRETAIQKVYWNEDGWLRLSHGGNKPARYVEELIQNGEYIQSIMEDKTGVSEQLWMGYKMEKDEFGVKRLANYYKDPRIPIEAINYPHNHNQNKNYLWEREGYLRLYGRESLNSLHHVSMIARAQREYEVVVETKLEFQACYSEQVAGLTYFYDAMNYYFLGYTVDDNMQAVIQLIQSDRGVITELTDKLPLQIENSAPIYMRIVTDSYGDSFSYLYSYDGVEWLLVKDNILTNILTDEHCLGFTGAHFGMFCFDMTGQRQYADFSYFSYGERIK